MNDSILDATKKTLNLSGGYVTFDHDIIMYINSAFSILEQLGVGPEDGYFIESNEETWADYVGDPAILPRKQLNLVKTYIYLKTRMLFDPPTTSYLITAMEKQIAELEYRLNTNREIVIQQALDEIQEVV